MPYPYEVGQRLARPEVTQESASVARTTAQRAADRAHPLPRSERVTLQSLMLGARALAPLYRSVLLRPGLQARPEAFAQAFETLKRLYQTSLDRICREVQSEQSEAVLRVALAGPVAALVADAWELADASTPPQVQSREMEHLVELYARQAIASQDSPLSPAEQDTAGSSSQLASGESVAEFRAVCTAMLGLLQVWTLRPATQRLYLSDQHPQDVVAHIRLTLTDSAAEIAGGMVPEASDLEQTAVYSSVLEGLGELYRYTLEAQFNELSRRIRDMDASQKRAYLEDIPKHPRGLLVECTDELFMTVVPGCYAVLGPSEFMPWRDDSPVIDSQEETFPYSQGVTARVSSSRSPGQSAARPDLGLEYRDGA